jgi:hypothetical protein
LKSHQIEIPIPKFGIPNFVLRKELIYLILRNTLTAIAQLVELTILNRMVVGTIYSIALLLPIYPLLKMIRCDFSGLNNHATKLTSTQNE